MTQCMAPRGATRLFVLGVAVWVSCLGVYQFADDPSQAEVIARKLGFFALFFPPRKVLFYTDPKCAAQPPQTPRDAVDQQLGRKLAVMQGMHSIGFSALLATRSHSWRCATTSHRFLCVGVSSGLQHAAAPCHEALLQAAVHLLQLHLFAKSSRVPFDSVVKCAFMSPISVAMLPKSSACRTCPYTLPTQVLRTILLCYKNYIHITHGKKGPSSPAKAAISSSPCLYTVSVLGQRGPSMYTIQKSCYLCTYEAAPHWQKVFDKDFSQAGCILYSAEPKQTCRTGGCCELLRGGTCTHLRAAAWSRRGCLCLWSQCSLWT